MSFYQVSWITSAWSYELQNKNQVVKNNLTNLLANFENSWLGVTDMATNKNELQKYKDFKYMKELVRNLTDFSLYLKKKPQENKVPIAEIFIRKMNNMLVERRQKFARKETFDAPQELLIPFQLSNPNSATMVVF